MSACLRVCSGGVVCLPVVAPASPAASAEGTGSCACGSTGSEVGPVDPRNRNRTDTDTDTDTEIDTDNRDDIDDDIDVVDLLGQ